MTRLGHLLAIAATLLGAGLLFLVEPMVAKMVLPVLGGAPSVWNTCMLFFQVALLAGYLYALLLSRIRPVGGRALVHVGVLAASILFLPLGIGAAPPDASSRPVAWLLGDLAVSIGLPFFALSATGPLVQQWLHGSGHARGEDPYPLYAWSNFGSLAALLGYPLLIEPFLPLRRAAGAWSAGYLAFVAVMIAYALVVARQRGPEAQRTIASGVSARTRAGWVFLAFVPSAAFLAITQYMSTDIAVFPLLWVLPLAVYLVTLIVAFARGGRPVAGEGVGLAVAAAAAVASFWAFRRPYTWVLFLLHPLVLFFLGLVCHGRLVRARPGPDRLAEFYVFVALGGALGGVFSTFVAPRCFDSIAEYPILLVIGCLLRAPGGAPPAKERLRRARLLDLALPAALVGLVIFLAAAGGAFLRDQVSEIGWIFLQVGLPCTLVLLFLRRPLRFALGIALLLVAVQVQTRSQGQVLHVSRDFFGVHKVVGTLGPGIDGVDASGKRVSTGVPFHYLFDGTTRHGGQALTEPLRSQPTSYFHRTGPLGEVFETLGAASRLDEVAVVGLGAGTIAAYGRPGRSITFYEIVPEVASIARDERFFTYLGDSRGACSVEIADGREGLGRAADGRYGLIVVDAFSSDAVPIHLMTREAIALYFRKLRPDGLLAAHVTNQHLDLEPVFHAIAADLGLRGRSKFDEVASMQELEQGKDRSHWIVLARSEEALGALAEDPDWLPVPVRADAGADRRFLWTDDYSSVLRVLRVW